MRKSGRSDRLFPAGLLCLLIVACRTAPQNEIEAFVLPDRQRIGVPASNHGPSSVLIVSSQNSSGGSSSDSISGSGGVGPKAGGRRRPGRSGPRSGTTSPASTTGPKSSSTRPRSGSQRRGSEPPQRGPPQEEKPFDGRALTAAQVPNLDAPVLDLRAAMTESSSPSPPGEAAPTLRCVTPGLHCADRAAEPLAPPPSAEPPKNYEYRSLDDLLAAAGVSAGVFPLSELFNSDEAFRNELRSAIRLDVFETTPFYAKLPEKAKTVLLLPDSSLEGSWRIPEAASIAENDDDDDDDDGEATPNPSESDEGRAPAASAASLRMQHTTRVLNAALEQHCDGDGDDQPTPSFTGDDLFRAIGSLCGSGASTHWIDIYGVQDREINHSWHLDAGRSPDNCRTVLWGFPPENHYEGTGVFSHLVGLAEPFDDMVGGSIEHHNRMEPVLFEGQPPDRCVVRPGYAPGRELLLYRDVDVLHSAPDVAYRTSVMRFM